MSGQTGRRSDRRPNQPRPGEPIGGGRGRARMPGTLRIAGDFALLAAAARPWPWREHPGIHVLPGRRPRPGSSGRHARGDRPCRLPGHIRPSATHCWQRPTWAKISLISTKPSGFGTEAVRTLSGQVSSKAMRRACTRAGRSALLPTAAICGTPISIGRPGISSTPSDHSNPVLPGNRPGTGFSTGMVWRDRRDSAGQGQPTEARRASG